MLGTILIIGTHPLSCRRPSSILGLYSQNWGYAPSGLLGTILIVVLILFLLGRL